MKENFVSSNSNHVLPSGILPTEPETVSFIDSYKNNLKKIPVFDKDFEIPSTYVKPSKSEVENIKNMLEEQFKFYFDDAFIVKQLKLIKYNIDFKTEIFSGYVYMEQLDYYYVYLNKIMIVRDNNKYFIKEIQFDGLNTKDQIIFNGLKDNDDIYFFNRSSNKITLPNEDEILKEHEKNLKYILERNRTETTY